MAKTLHVAEVNVVFIMLCHGGFWLLLHATASSVCTRSFTHHISPVTKRQAVVL